MNNCGNCNSGELKEMISHEETEYKGERLSFEMKYSVCRACDFEIVHTNQIRHNDKLLKEAKRKFDGLLSGCEIKEARECLKLTQEEASLVFGGGKNAFSKYERSEISQSVAMDKLIRVSLNYSLAFRYLKAIAGLQSSGNIEDYSDNLIIYPFKQKKTKGNSQSNLIKTKTTDTVEVEMYG